MGIFFNKPQPIFSQDQQIQIQKQKFKGKPQLKRYNYVKSMEIIYKFYNNFVNSIYENRKYRYIKNLKINEISNVMLNFEILKRLEVVNIDNKRGIFNINHINTFFAPFLAGLIFEKSKISIMNKNELRKLQRKFNHIFEENYSYNISKYVKDYTMINDMTEFKKIDFQKEIDIYNKKAIENIVNIINLLHDNIRLFSKKYFSSLATIEQNQPALYPQRTRSATGDLSEVDQQQEQYQDDF